MGRLEFGILDVGTPRGARGSSEILAQTLELAALAERCGYDRYWVAEHHDPSSAQASPALMLPLLAARTTTIRLGTGALLLPYASPFKVAEDFILLETLFPGRIELGIGRGPGATPPAREALLGGALGELQVPRFVAKTEELLAYLRRDPALPSRATPHDARAPPAWLMASTPEAAAFAGRMGTGMAFAAFLCPPDALEAASRAVVTAYRDAFARAHPTGTPHAISAPSVFAAVKKGETDLIRSEFAAANARPPAFLGDARACAGLLRDYGQRHGFDGLLLAPFPSRSFSIVTRSLRSLARELGLKPRRSRATHSPISALPVASG